MSLLAALMRSAINRRTPITLISEVAAAVGATFAAWLTAAPTPVELRSLRKMRPPGPEPAALDKSIPASRARRRLAGEVMTRAARPASLGAPGISSSAAVGILLAADTAAGAVAGAEGVAGAG